MVNSSAYFGDPPNTQDDFWICKYLLENAGSHRDPAKGVPVSPARPPASEYQFETKGPAMIGGLCVCIFIMAFVTGLRLYVRIFNKNLRAGLDDWLIVLGVFLAIAYPSLQIAMVNYGGGGKHMYNVTYHEFYIFHWLSAVAQIDFFISIGIVKMSITAFNMRLTNMASRHWMYAHWTFFAALFCYTLIAFFLNVFTCMPASASYDAIMAGKLVNGFKCIPIAHMNTILRAINITMDYCLLAVPIIVLWHVQMDWWKKAKLFLLFSVGALACIGSVMALVSKFRLKSDTSWNYTTLLAWTLVELTLGVSAASLPVLSGFFPSIPHRSASTLTYKLSSVFSSKFNSPANNTRHSKAIDPSSNRLSEGANPESNTGGDNQTSDGLGSKSSKDEIMIHQETDVDTEAGEWNERGRHSFV